MTVATLRISCRIALVGLFFVTAALTWNCGGETQPTTPTMAPTAASTPTTSHAATALTATPALAPTTAPVPASNIPFPTPTSSPTPNPAMDAFGSAIVKLWEAGGAAIEISANLEALSDGHTVQISISYTGVFAIGGLNWSDLVVAAPVLGIESRVMTLAAPFLTTVHVLDESSGNWEANYGHSSYSFALDKLFVPPTYDFTNLELSGREELNGIDVHVFTAKLRDFAVAGSRGDLDVVYWIGVDDGLLLKLSASGALDVGADTMLIGGTVAESASVKLTATVFDHGRQVDVVSPTLGLQRFQHEALLLDDGRVLVGGGFTGISNNNVVVPFPVGLIETYDPSTDLWSFQDPMEDAGVLYSALKLADGRVLLVGLAGFEDSVEAFASLFDPVANSWEEAPAPSTPRGFPETLLLDDGRVLLVGGWDFTPSDTAFSQEVVKAVEVYDPQTGEWRQAAPLIQDFKEPPYCILLNDGLVLAMGVGGDIFVERIALAELYDPTADSWTPISSTDTHYAPGNAIGLADGRVLVLGSLPRWSIDQSPGGSPGDVILPDGRRLTASQVAEQYPASKIYHPAVDEWSAAEGMTHARNNASLTLLSDGSVLAAGGENYWSKDSLPYSTTEIFDPQTNSWSPGPDLSVLRAGATATLMPDGRVLLVGGMGLVQDIEEIYPHATAEIVDPG